MLQLAVKVRADTAEFTAGMAQSGAAVERFGTQARSSGQSASLWAAEAQRSAAAGRAIQQSQQGVAAAMAVATRAAAAMGIALSVEQAIQYADAWKQVEGRLKLVTSGSAELKTVQAQLFDVAQRTRQSFDATADTFARFARSTKGLNVGNDDLLRVTETINQAVAVSGASSASAEAALFQLGQAMAAGALRGEELNSVLEQTPRLAEAIAAGMGVSTGELKGLAEQNKLTAEAVMKALLSQGAAVQREFQQLGPTVAQAFTTLENATKRYIGGIDQATGATRYLAAGITAIGENLPQVIDGLLALATVAAGLKAAMMFGPMVTDTIRLAEASATAAGQAAVLRAETAASAQAAAASAGQRAANAAATLAEVSALKEQAVRQRDAATAQMELTRGIQEATGRSQPYQKALNERNEATRTLLSYQRVERQLTAEAAAAAGAKATADAAAAQAQAAVAGTMQRTTLAARAMATAQTAANAALSFVGGPIGAAILATVAAVTLLASRTSEAERAQQAYNAVVKEGEQRLSELTSASRSRANQILEAQRQSISGAQAEVDSIRARVAALREERAALEELQRASALPGITEGPTDKINDLTRQLAEAEKRLQAAHAAMDRLMSVTQTTGDAIGAEMAANAGRGSKALTGLTTALTDAQKAAGLTIERGQQLTDDQAQLAKYTSDLTTVIDAGVAAWSRYRMTAAQAANVLEAVRLKLDPVRAAVADLNAETNRLRIPEGFERDFAALLARVSKNGQLALTAEQIGELRQALGDNRAAQTDDQAGRLEREAAGQRLLAGALTDAAKARAQNRVALAEEAAKWPELGQATATAILTTKDLGGTVAKLPPELQRLWAAMQSNSAAQLAGGVNSATDAMSRQARQTLELAAATRLGGAAVAEVQLRHEVENQTLAVGAGARSALAGKIRQEAAARRELVAAQFDREIDVQIAAVKELANAETLGAKAVADATVANAAAAQIEREGIAADSARAKTIQDKTAELAKWQQRQAYEKATRIKTDDIRLLELELSLQGESEAIRSRTLDLARAEMEIRREFPDLAEQDIQALLAKEAKLLDIRGQIDRQQNAWKQLSDSLERAFDRVGDALVEAFVQGKSEAVDWGRITKGIIASIISDLIKMAAVQPLKNMMFGTNSPTLWDAFGSSGGAAAQNGAGGGYGQYVQAGQSLYNAATGTNTLGTAANSFATSGMGYSMGLSSKAVADGTGIAAGYVDTIGSTQIVNGTTLTSSGQAVTSTLGAIGAAAPYGMLGGMAGSYIGNAAGGNKVVGGLSGAAIGVGSYAAGTAALGAMGVGTAAAGMSGMAGATAALSAIPVYGWIAAAVLATVMAVVGTQKASVGPNAAATLRVEGGQLVRVASHADNGGSTDRVNAVTDAAAVAVNALTQFGVRVNEGAQYMYVEGGPKVLNNGRRAMAPEQYFKEIIGGLSADGLVGRVLQSDAITKTGDLEKLVKGAALAKSVENSSTALDKLANTLQSVQQEAFKATAEALSPMVEEFKLASELGFGNEYLEVTNKQIESMLKGFSAEDIEKPQALQIAMAELTGKMGAFREQVLKVNPALAGLIDTIEEAAREKLVKDYRRDFDAGMNSAQGNGFLNQLTDARTWWNNNWANSLEAGRNPNDMYAAQAQAILAGLDITQLGKAVEYFRDLDPVMAGLAAAARDIARQDALADFGMRELAARVRLGEVAQDAYDLRALEIEQRREAANVTDDVVRAELTRIHGLERAALVAERQAQAEAELTAQRERAVAAAGDVLADLDRTKASGATGLTPDERIKAVDSMLRRDLALARSDDPVVAEEAMRRLTQTKQTAQETYNAVYGAGSTETTAMLRAYEQSVRDLPAVLTWQQQVLERLAALPSAINANLDLRGRILEIYEPAVLQRVDPALRPIIETLATLAEQGYDFTSLPPNSQRTIDEVLTRMEGGVPVVALDFSNVPAHARRDLVEVLGRFANDNRVDEFEWALLPADARRAVAEVMGTYRNGIQVDRLTFSDVPADTQREVAELLERLLNGDAVTDWTPITLPGNASRTVTETVKRDVSETVTSASMRELTAGYQAAQLQTTSMIIRQLDALGRIELTSGINIVRAITGVWGWGQEQLDALARTAQPIVLSTQEAGYVARYADIADTWTKNPGWSPLQHYLQAGQFQGRTFSVGGRVDGPGTDTSDDVPAWLSRDEYVLRAQAARNAGYEALEALNTGRVAEAARMLAVRANDNAPRFARGGRVGSITSAGATTIAATGAASPWDGGSATAITRLTGEVQRLTAEVVALRRERAEDAGRSRRLMEGIGADQIGMAERQEQQLRRIGGRRRPVL
ncbi:hypothetical protein D3093_26905 (plasmid) [Azospirillum argentinense]|uniref:Tape measure protein N-terminal domain-containing protein n=1 Tax=Azospirillum argentinense TaxID=2970906 RepID=A0A4D8PQG5_9PROT|nr:tape measure protein [Azospirillum argentinense]QCN98917.1 hypothetical protein D3093_26905 [Azospirillum argentinense]